MNVQRELNVAARIENLPDLVRVATDATVDDGADAATLHDVRLAVEEVCTNIIEHGYCGVAGSIHMRVSVANKTLVIRIQDDAPQFDPTNLPDPELNAPQERRVPGKLGWHLTRKVMDEVKYDAGGVRGNIITLVKRLPQETTDSSSKWESSMNTMVDAREKIGIVHISGSIDGTTVANLQGVFDQQLEAGNVWVVAEMSNVEYTSSAGLRVLLGTMKNARSRGGDLRLVAPRRDVLRVLQLSGFTGILKIFDSVEDAVEGYGT